MTQPMVRLSGLYKIFGARDKDVLHHVQDGMGKEELLAQHGHVSGAQQHQRRYAGGGNHSGHGPVRLG